MPEPIRQLNLLQFAQLLGIANLSRRITAVHLHHTWRPRHRDFRGRSTIEAMRSYHMNTNKWSDIAQHLTIDPIGSLWTGRNWNLPPASSSGQNGTSAAGPFMIEMVGDFDQGQDPFDGAQRAAAVQVVAQILRRFELTADAGTVKFHNQLGSPKTCPGTSVDYATLLKEIAAVPAPKALKGRQVESPFAPEHRVGFSVSRDVDDADLRGFKISSTDEVPEDEASARDIEQSAHDAARRRTMARGGAVFQARPAGDSQWNDLKRHAISLSRGELSEGGQFSTTPADLDAIVEGIRAHVATGETPHVLLYAHGGLVSEETALTYASTVKDWWLKYGVYPVFFIWETDLLQILRQFAIGPRDVFDFTTDPAIEVLVKGPGTLVWSGMKESARRASAEDASDGNPGGALQFVRRLSALAAVTPSLKVHAIGHSAGSIFHAHLLPALARENVKTETLSFLAPAIRTDLFTDKLLPIVQDHTIRKMAMFTMHEDAERADDCFGVYRKSLLYLVSRACEGFRRRPILGLKESVDKDAALTALFAGGTAELQLSPPLGDDPNPLTAALRHGDFDNDPKTMSSALRRIVGEPDDSRLGEEDFPFDLKPRFFDLDVLTAAAATPGAAAAGTGEGTAVTAGPAVVTGPGPRRIALCVGIDAYPQRPLAGCVRDARLWSKTLASAGFQVNTLFDAQATRQSLVDNLERLVSGGRPGDILVFQYSGHGTQMPDDDGDEVDAFDEAFVPIDYGQGRFLLDDDIGVILSKLAPGAVLTLFMDCCHSGTNSRFAPLVRAVSTRDERVRYLPPSAELVDAHRAYRRSARAAPGPTRPPEGSLPGVVHFAACQDNEYAWETQGQGDFTAIAAPLLAKALSLGQTNEMFLADVQAGVAQKNRQHPLMMKLPGNLANRPLLSGLTIGV